MRFNSLLAGFALLAVLGGCATYDDGYRSGYYSDHRYHSRYDDRYYGPHVQYWDRGYYYGYH